MKYGKALEEIWVWRKQLSKKLENLSKEEQLNYINESARKACEKYELHCVEEKEKQIA
jgi:hypothetical protein